MKKILLFILVVSIPEIIFSQEESKDNIIIISTRDFALRTFKFDGAKLIDGKVDIKLTATSKSRQQKIHISLEKDTILVLDYPLSFQYFSDKFKDSIAANFDSKILYYESVMDVFNWIVGINNKIDRHILSGDLYLQQGLITYNNLNEPLYDDREANKFKIFQEIERVKGILNGYKQQKLDVIRIQSLPGGFTRYSMDQLSVDTLSSNKELFDAEKKYITSIDAEKTGDKDFAYKSKTYNFINGKDSVENRKTLDGKFEDKSGLFRLGDAKDNSSYYLIKNTKNMHVLSNIYIYEDSVLQTERAVLLKNYYKIEKVKFQFEKGFLERVQVYVKYGIYQKTQIFENLYPIGFTSVLNYKKNKEIRLFIRNSSKDDGTASHIFLSDVIQNYDNDTEVNRKDYSPGDTSFTAYPASNPLIKLYKERALYILEGKTFTDASGFKENSPNGLVQIELNRRFNLKTNRLQVGNTNNYGYLTYLIAKVNFSKLEEKGRDLFLKNQKGFENGVLITPSYATNMDFLRYENLSIRIETNAFLWDYPEGKMTFYLDGGFKYGHTPVVDTVFVLNTDQQIIGTGRDLDAHNFTFYPKVWVEVFAERRYGLSMGYQFNHTTLFTNNNYKQVLSYSGKGNDLSTLSLNKSSRWSHTIELKGHFGADPSNNNTKIFAVARFNFQHKDVNTFYPQILIGYAFNVFK